jgi:undecaprenyl-diphosphatase
MIRELLAHRRFRFWLLLSIAAIALLGFVEVVDDFFRDPLEGDLEAQAFDRAIGRWVAPLRSARLTQVMTELTALGSVSVVATLFLVHAAILASFRDFRGLGYLGGVFLGAGAWPLLLKPLFGRERPRDLEHLALVTDLSFPSGHAFGAAATYVALAYYAGQYARSWPQEVFFYCLGGILVVVVGVTRIYLGVHYPTDVLAGICGGAAWGFFASALLEAAAPARRKRA